jgi:1-deoxy-D-xylulose-5-phosphate synthase
MYTAQLGLENPISIRYPRGRGVLLDWERPFEKMEIGTAFELKKGTKIAILSTGTIGNSITQVLKEITNDQAVGHYNFPFIKPLDTKHIHQILKNYEHIITVEDGSAIGGFGSGILEVANDLGSPKEIKVFGIPDVFIPHGTQEELYQLAQIDIQSIRTYIERLL